MEKRNYLRRPPPFYYGHRFLLWVMSEKGETETWSFFKKLKTQVKMTTPSWDLAYGLFKKGQGRLVFSYWTSPAYHIQEENNHDYKAAPFEKGNYLQKEYVVAAPKKNKEKLQRDFLDFLLSEFSQKEMAKHNFMYPAVKKTPLPPAFLEIGTVKELLRFFQAHKKLNFGLRNGGRFFLTTFWLLIVNFGSLLFLLLRLSVLKGFDFQTIQGPFFASVIFTFNQALLSSVASVILGLAAAPGYSRLGRFQKTVKWILLFPNIMSPVLAILALLTSFKNFPFGMLGIVLGHVFLNAGLCTVWLGDSWKVFEEKWAPINFNLGGSSWIFFKKVIGPQMIPVILNTLAVIFSFCISSFAIPFVLGGSPQYSTLEVFIYEKLRASGDLGSAVFIGFVQSALQFLIFFFILKNIKERSLKVPQGLIQLKKLSLLTLPTATLTILILVPILKILDMGIPQWPKLHDIIYADAFAQSAFNSILISLAVGGITFLTLPLISTFGIKSYFLKVPGLSDVVIGLGCFIVMTGLHMNEHFKFVLLLTYGHFCVIFLPILRLCWPKISSTRDNFNRVVSQLGATNFLALKKVYLPLDTKLFISAAGLASIWSMGEFTVSRVLTGEYSTLPIFISNLISSYRLELASGVATLLLFTTVISITFIEVLSGMD